MVTNTYVERESGAWVGIIIALLVIGLMIAYFSGAFSGMRSSSPTENRMELPSLPGPVSE